MFCEKCGAQIEPGEMFCGNCGARIENSAPAPAFKPTYTPTYTPSVKRGGTGLAALTSSGLDIKMIVAGVVMFIATLLPVISVNLGKYGEGVMEFLGGVLPESMSKLKYNLYQYVSLLRDDYIFGLSDGKKTMILIAMIFIILTIVVSIAAGVLKNKTLMLVSGVMCSICIVICIAEFIIVGGKIRELNADIAAELGEYAKVFGGSIKIGNIHGIGIYLFLIACGAQTYFSFTGARNAA